MTTCANEESVERHLGYFRQEVLASYQNQPDKYVLETDYFEGNLTVTDNYFRELEKQGRACESIDILFGYRALKDGNLAIAIFLHDLCEKSESHMPQWKGFYLPDPDWPPEPDERFSLWKRRYLDGDWDVESGARAQVSKLLVVINGLTCEALGLSLFQHELGSDVKFPGGQNTHCYQDAHGDLYRYLIDGLEEDCVAAIARHAGTALSKTPKYTKENLKAALSIREDSALGKDKHPSLQNVRDTTDAQRKFYSDWVKKFEAESYVDLQGNFSYVLLYLFSALGRFVSDRDLERLFDTFNRVKKAYGNYQPVPQYIEVWITDAYLLLGDYDKAWELIKAEQIQTRNLDTTPGNLETMYTHYVSAELILNVRCRCSETFIDGQDLIDMSRMHPTMYNLSDFGKEHLSEIAALATQYLEELQHVRGKNLVEYYCRRFDLSNLSDDAYSDLRGHFRKPEDMAFWLEQDERYRWPQMTSHALFATALVQGNRILKWERIPQTVVLAIGNEGSRILRECENALREEMNIPRVGERWKNETKLFYQIQNAFPKEKVVHHGRPFWLGPQHLDVYLPEKNIGIEYQGEQHQSPLEHWGGESALAKRQDLDERKKKLCEDRDCILIYVYEGYDFANLKGQLDSVVAMRSS